MANKNLTLFSLFGICLGGFLSASVNAQHNNPASIGIELTGGWFREMVNNGGYGLSSPGTVDFNDVTFFQEGSLLDVDPKGEFGGAIQISYYFPCSPYALAFTYWGLHTDSSRAQMGPTQSDVNQIFAFGLGTSDYAGGISEVNFHNDFFNLSLGATFHPDPCFSFTPAIGVSYLHIKNNQNSTYYFPATAFPPLAYDLKSTFHGLGTSFGASLDYKFINRISFFGSLTYNALVGNISARRQSVLPLTGNPVNDPILQAEFSADAELRSRNRIVSLIQSELGLSYLFCPKYSGEFKLGYAIQNAFGASERGIFLGDGISPDLPAPFEASFQSFMSDVGFQGPFARFSAEFNL